MRNTNTNLNDLNNNSEYLMESSSTGMSSFYDDHLVIMTSFVDVHYIFSNFADLETGKLTHLGAKHFLGQLRRVQFEQAITDMRDSEDGVAFLAGLRMDEVESFIMRCPNTVWNLINSPSMIEFVHREIGKYAQKSATPERLFQILTKHMNAQCLTQDMIDDSLVEMGIVHDPTFVLDIWLRKLFIKHMSSNSGGKETHACEFILNELMILNRELEREYIKSLMPTERAMSVDSNDPRYQVYDPFEPSETKSDIDVGDGDLTVANYLTINTLLADFGRFGNMLVGLKNAEPICFSASNTSIEHAPLLYSQHCYQGSGKKNSFEFLQIDLQRVCTAFAIAIQGHPTENNWVTEATLEYSVSSDDMTNNWQAIALGQAQTISCENNTSVKIYIFSRWTKARFIRLNIYDWHNAPCVRLDLLFGSVSFADPSSMLEAQQ
jgi:hypothetical protein